MNEEYIASARLRGAMEERQGRLARYAANIEEDLASDSLCRSGEERKIILARDTAINEA